MEKECLARGNENIVVVLTVQQGNYVFKLMNSLQRILTSNETPITEKGGMCTSVFKMVKLVSVRSVVTESSAGTIRSDKKTRIRMMSSAALRTTVIR